LVDSHFRPLSITFDEVRRFNGPVVLLQERLAQTYAGGETLDIQILLSNYSGETIESGVVRAGVSCDGQKIEERELPVTAFPNGQVAPVGAVRVVLPELSEPGQIRVEAVLESASVRQKKNDWTAWLFPSAPFKPSMDVALYASTDLVSLLEPFGAIAMPEGDAPLPHAVYVARQPSEALVSAAETGACVVLLSPAGVFPTDYTSYKPAWWLGVFEGDSNAGTFVYDNPITHGLTPDGWCDASWFHLLQGAQTFLLDDLPAPPEVLIRALNTHGAPHPFSRYIDFEYVWRNKALLMQAKVGEGALILSGINFDLALGEGGPEASHLLGRIFEYAKGFPRPAAEWPVEFVRDSVVRSPFAKGPLVSGFQRLASHQGEKATGQTCRERNGEVYRIRQEEPMHRIVWETDTVPEAPYVTFVFAGGFPFLTPPSSPPGFTLTVNGRRVVDFDTTQTQAQWAGVDKRTTLLYVPGHVQPSWSESAGRFYLSVPAELVTPGSPCTLEVRSRGSDNKRWFGLHPYADLLLGSAAAKG
ncbi:MAG: hypothetical protein WC655_23455, partial [Candidatus Hydrogenedentales bacterium]